MGIVHYLVLAAIVGFIAWALVKWVPMPAGVKTLVTWSAVVILVLILLNAMGFLPNDYPIPRVGGR